MLNVFALVLSFLLFTVPGLATPLHRRPIDLDHNGIPDFCVYNANGGSKCLENGSWTVIYPSQISSIRSSPTLFTVTPITVSNTVVTSVLSTNPVKSSSTPSAIIPITDNDTTVTSSVSETSVTTSTAPVTTTPITTSNTVATSAVSSIAATTSTTSSTVTAPVTTTPTTTTNTVATGAVSSIAATTSTTFSTVTPVTSNNSVSTSAVGTTSVTTSLSALATVTSIIASNTVTTNVVSTSTATTSPSSALPTGTLPSPAQFKIDNGTKWSIQYVGDIEFTGALASKNLEGDKCRSSKLGDKIIWNCGDMECAGNSAACGFAMGPAFYGTDDVMNINTTGVVLVQDNSFVMPWSGDSTPQAPTWIWGMDTSNVAAINDTHGVAYAWEVWRTISGGSIIDRGNAVASITLGSSKPLANRVGPLLTGSDAVQLGLLAIMRDGDYIYLYSSGGPSALTVTRVKASDDVFDSTKYQSLQYGTTTWANAIPNKSDTGYGMTTANTSGKFGCSVYGSVFYSNYFQKYTIICSIFDSFVNMYTSDTPYGPWSEEYSLLAGWYGYGSMAHPTYSPGGSHKEIYLSQGPGTEFNMFKLSFGY